MAFQTKLLNGLQEFIDQITEYVKLCVVPVGTVTMYMGKGTTPPKGWLFCDGTTIDKDKYPKLYDLIGSKTPNMTDKFPMGTDTSGDVGKSVAPGLPNIVGSWGSVRNNSKVSGSGAFVQSTSSYSGTGAIVTGNGSGTRYNSLVLDARACSPVYGRSRTVQPPAIKIRYIIRAE